MTIDDGFPSDSELLADVVESHFLCVLHDIKNLPTLSHSPWNDRRRRIKSIKSFSQSRYTMHLVMHIS